MSEVVQRVEDGGLVTEVRDEESDLPSVGVEKIENKVSQRVHKVCSWCVGWDL